MLVSIHPLSQNPFRSKGYQQNMLDASRSHFFYTYSGRLWVKATTRDMNLEKKNHLPQSKAFERSSIVKILNAYPVSRKTNIRVMIQKIKDHIIAAHSRNESELGGYLLLFLAYLCLALQCLLVAYLCLALQCMLVAYSCIALQSLLVTFLSLETSATNGNELCKSNIIFMFCLSPDSFP